jgi:Siphovirus-type tail component, C-terminal domain
LAVTSITLADPTQSLSSVIFPRAGIATTSLEVEPAVRAVTEDRVAGHGAVDSTAYLSAASVVLNLLLYGDGITDGTGLGIGQAAFLDEIGPMLNPGKRPVLIVTDSDWPQTEGRQITLRLDSMLKARSDPTNWAVQVNWAAPNGVWEDASTTELDVPVTLPSTTGLIITNTTGLHISATNGLDMPPTSAPGEFSASNPGNLPSQWTGSLYGPAIGPKVANDTVGLALEFTDDVVLQAGDYVALDSAARSAFLNGDPGSSLLSNINFSTSTWFQLQPGTNTLRYYPTSGSAGAEAVLVYRPSWLP